MILFTKNVLSEYIFCEQDQESSALPQAKRIGATGRSSSRLVKRPG